VELLEEAGASGNGGYCRGSGALRQSWIGRRGFQAMTVMSVTTRTPP